jgi:magnesium chelatase family protein
MRAQTCTAVLDGAIAHLVDAEAETEAIVTDGGLPFTVLIGLPDSSVRETRDRVRAAVVNSGELWPAVKVIVGLRPESLHKPGGSLDLAIAVAVMAADGTVPARPAGQPVLFFAELGLDGSLRPVPGALPAALAAVAGGISTVVVAAQSAAEASHAPGVRVIPACCLADVAAWLRGGPGPPPQAPGGLPGGGPGNTAEPSGEPSKGDVVVIGEVALAVAGVGWTPVRGGLNEVRTSEYGTRPLPARSQPPEAADQATTPGPDQGAP